MRIIKLRILIVMALVILSGCNKEPALPVLYTLGAGVTDADGNSYKTILINGQEWMTSNLRTTRYCDGSPITEFNTIQEIMDASEGGWTYYEFDATNENPHGKLYNGYAVTDNRNPCPCGWHIPTNEEWDQLITFLGGQDIAGDKMKAISNEYNWTKSNDTKLINSSGFSALPSGSFSNWPGGQPVFGDMKNNAHFWSSTTQNTLSTWHYTLSLGHSTITKYQFNNNNLSTRSIRCIKD